MKKKASLLTILSIVIAVISIFVGMDDAPFEVHFIDVGQGDAIFIRQEAFTMLIDAGEPQMGDRVVAYLENQGVTKLNYVIGTHPHADHIGGLSRVLEAFDVDEIIMPKVTHTSATYENLLLTIKKKGYKVTLPQVGDQYALGDAHFLILSPSQEYDDLNNWSVAMKVSYENVSFVFTGDAEALAEEHMLTSGLLLSANVLKLGHHGSQTSTTEAFLRQVNPEYAVIQVGKGNPYGHPHREVLNRLSTVKVYRTDLHGTVIFQTDGVDIHVFTDKEGR